MSWRLDGIRGLWLKVAKQHASLIPMCIQVRMPMLDPSHTTACDYTKKEWSQRGHEMVTKWSSVVVNLLVTILIVRRLQLLHCQPKWSAGGRQLLLWSQEGRLFDPMWSQSGHNMCRKVLASDRKVQCDCGFNAH